MRAGRPPGRPAAWWVAAVLLLAAGLAPARADAHAIGLSRGDYCLHGDRLDASLVFSRAEVEGLALAEGVSATVTGAPCLLSKSATVPEENDGVRLTLSFTCPVDEGSRPATVDLGLFEDLPFGHRHMAQRAMPEGSTGIHLAFRSNRSFEVPASAAPCASDRQAGEPDAPTVFGFFALGVEHILTGYDHLVFLFGLILVGGRIRALLGVVTAFTIGHSVTLALAALDVFVPPSRWVEAGIALSIAWVGIENFWVKNAEKRWRVTLPFGLLHGFGFAGVLREIGLPDGQVGTALVTFNLGVEAGQMAVLAVALPIIVWARKKKWFGPAGVKVVSGAIVLAGLLWFGERLAGG